MPMIDLPYEELLNYRGRNPRPNDFDAYWERGLAEMKEVDAKLEIVPNSFSTSQVECFDLYFTGVKGARIHALYARPRHATTPHPAILQFHGYKGHAGDWLDKMAYAAHGFTVVAMNCRGQGGHSQDTHPVRGMTSSGHVVRGLEDHPDNLYFRQVFLDTAQLANIVMNLPEVDPDLVGVTGWSQGGALTVACAALEPRIRRAAPVYPFLSDYLRVWEMDFGGVHEELIQYFRNRDPLHANRDLIFEKLGYIDIQHLADRIKAEVLWGIGLMDKVCPPSTQFAAYNRIRSPKRMVVYPDFQHEWLPGMNDAIFEWMLSM
ncbi:acetylxylan esterase [Alicyclobacillus hesperidum]|uniref:Acetylxylan esterase n=1 Tax=Alicyclobacillus hesperidum TaxID=89784 RepID=A0A1H2Q839_9BACL|nr:acetylxylan esterase [Alicyclobacillus hesperidum]GLV12758.1 acetylxylan esterase [Alicyclobacillus hesperidum]SDW03311.1 cephalosporin-C deacetylase [Alicyclobacillus hesperidum]